MIKGKHALIGLLALIPLAVPAVTVAILDSGVDYKHETLVDKMWKNPIEAPLGFNNRDDDKNGYQDDIYGWNFFGQDSQVIDYKYLGTFSNDPKKFYEIQLKSMQGKATADDQKWVKEKLEDEEFVKEITKFSNFIHGTHVSGITSSVEKDAQIMAIRMIPVELELPIPGGIASAASFQLFNDTPFVSSLLSRAQDKPPLANQDRDLVTFIIKKALDALAVEQTKLLAEIAEYANSHKVDVINGSFGTGAQQAAMIVGTLYKLLSGKDIQPEDLAELTVHFLKGLSKEGEKVAASAPNTLFVFASGNDGLNNDILPSSPASIQADNVIAVGASFGRDKIAEFSNFGKKSVHVLAPGVGISSAIPGDEYIAASGTSQAAPFVSGVAAKILKLNPKLKPIEVKKILMDTVDVKTDAQLTTISGGIVNEDRAAKAATLSKSESLTKAISMANKSVKDINAAAFRLESKLELPAPEKMLNRADQRMIMPLPSLMELKLGELNKLK